MVPRFWWKTRGAYWATIKGGWGGGGFKTRIGILGILKGGLMIAWVVWTICEEEGRRWEIVWVVVDAKEIFWKLKDGLWVLFFTQVFKFEERFRKWSRVWISCDPDLLCENKSSTGLWRDIEESTTVWSSQLKDLLRNKLCSKLISNSMSCKVSNLPRSELTQGMKSSLDCSLAKIDFSVAFLDFSPILWGSLTMVGGFRSRLVLVYFREANMSNLEILYISLQLSNSAY